MCSANKLNSVLLETLHQSAGKVDGVLDTFHTKCLLNMAEMFQKRFRFLKMLYKLFQLAFWLRYWSFQSMFYY